MARMILEAVADASLVHPAQTIGGTGGVGLLISVTDADGKPFTGLLQRNFKVQLMFNWFEGEATSTGSFLEEATQSFTGEHIPGIYSFVIFLANNGLWSARTFSVIIQATDGQTRGIQARDGQNHGQTIIQFRISRDQVK